MRTKMSELGGIAVAVTLLGTACASNAVAQEDFPRTRVQTASCTEVAWERDLLARYPRIAQGCQEVVIVEGTKWARFEADLVRTNRDGSVTLDFKGRNGVPAERLTLMPGLELRASIDGREYRFTELARGQTLNLYIPERMFAVAAQPGASAPQLAQIVAEPEQVAQAPTAQPQVAQASAPPQRLPSTAGPLPWLWLGGLVSVVAGLGLAIRRVWGALVVP